MNKHLLSATFLIFIHSITYSQSAVFDWAKSIGGSGIDLPNDHATDASGNVYSTGYFNGTVNFNPGGTYNLTSAGGDEAFISKLDASGNFVWAIKLGSTLNDRGNSIALDASNNVLVTGFFSGTVNFNPSGTFNLTSSGSYDIFIAKYGASGNFLWAKRMGGSSIDVAYALTLDASANIYTTGFFAGTANFNPGGTYNLSSFDFDEDVFVSKLDAAGNFVWAKQMGGDFNDEGHGITVDASSNVYTTGIFEDFATFGSTTHASAGLQDVFVSKLNSSGTFVWTKRMGGISGDGSGSIAVDISGNVYTAGSFAGVADFGSTNLTSIGGNDAYINKLDATGTFVWTRQMGGTLADGANSVTLDASGNIFTTGSFTDIADFNPGTGTNNLTSTGAADVFISKLDNSGNYVWAKKFGGTSADFGISVSVNSAGYIYTTGTFNGTANFNPNGTFNLTSGGSYDIFIQRMGPCTNTSNTINEAACLTYTLNSQTYTSTGTYTQILTNAAGCDSVLTINLRISNISSSVSSQTAVSCFGGNNGSAAILALGGIVPYSYSWTPSGGTNATGINLTASTYTCTITDSIGCVKTQVLTITQPSALSASASVITNASCTNDGSASVIASGGTSPYSYLWSNSVTLQNVTGLISGPYSITVTDDNGCTSSDNIVITNSILPPTPSICMVTVDGASVNNIIYWDQTTYTNADSFIVYREVSTSVYSRIGAVSSDSLSEFIDTSRSIGPANGNPNVGAYRYKLQVRDTCGNYSGLSPYHNTIYIIDAGLGQFTWSLPYAIEGAPNPVSNYVLLCDTANVDIWGPVGVVSGTQTSATDPGFSDHSSIANWRVKTNWSITCEPTRATVNTTRSNIKHAAVGTGIIAFKGDPASVFIYPNPAKDEVSVFLSPDIKNAVIKIINLMGQTVYEEKLQTSGGNLNLKLDVSGYSKGIYNVRIENGNSSVIKKLVIN